MMSSSRPREQTPQTICKPRRDSIVGEVAAVLDAEGAGGGYRVNNATVCHKHQSIQPMAWR